MMFMSMFHALCSPIFYPISPLSEDLRTYMLLSLEKHIYVTDVRNWGAMELTYRLLNGFT